MDPDRMATPANPGAGPKLGKDRPERRRSGSSVTTRLIGLVMVPVTAMCVLAGSVVYSRQSAAAQSQPVDHGAIAMSELVALGDALHSQQTVEAFDARYIEVGVTRAVATTFLGFDWDVQIAPARA